MAWHGSLALHYRPDPDASGPRTIGRGVHSGPLRVLQSLYPEGPAICHHVVVHPPGGVVGGDVLSISARLDAGTHALLTTPGATRFYRCDGEAAAQEVEATVAGGARLEWLPLETLVHDGARASNRLRFVLDAGAEMIGWDLLALGLPAAGEAYARGRFEQSVAIDVPGRRAWLERGVLDLDDPPAAARTRRLLDSPLGWAGQPVLATAWFASGTPLTDARCDALLEAARAALPDDAAVGVTAPNAHVVVLRALGSRVEPLMTWLKPVRAAWRALAWQCDGTMPRVWQT